LTIGGDSFNNFKKKMILPAGEDWVNWAFGLEVLKNQKNY
jgi:hypothetical protein